MIHHPLIGGAEDILDFHIAILHPPLYQCPPAGHAIHACAGSKADDCLVIVRGREPLVEDMPPELIQFESTESTRSVGSSG
jgi:hypothetical protein